MDGLIQKAIATSVGAKRYFAIIEEFIIHLMNTVGDLDLIFAATSRARKVNKKVISIYDLNKKIKNKNKKKLV